MTKYVDSGLGDTSNGKKKVKKGFKEDRRANYEKMLAKKNGKFRGKEPSSAAAAKTVRAKSVTFDPSALKEYVLTLHKRKNERRVQAFVDVKRKMRREHARDRRQQREEARLAYNNYARVPILPNYTYKLPRYEESDDDDEDADARRRYNEEEEDVSGNDEHGSTHAPTADADGDQDDEDVDLPWMFLGDGDASAQRAEDGARGGKRRGGDKKALKRARAEGANDVDADASLTEEEQARRRRLERKRRLKLVTTESTTHSMPMSMKGEVPVPASEVAAHAVDDEFVTVEVKPLFGRGGVVLGGSGASSSPAGKGKSGHGSRAGGTSSLPSNNFSDLPAVVEEELLRLRKETKGPTRTKPKLQMQKELQKIRKIRKYSRKGHGKKTTSGKRKNRKK